MHKGSSTTDHLRALNQIIEKPNEYNLLLYIGFIDHGKAIDTVAIFEALRKTNTNKTHINMLQNIYSQVTAMIRLDKLMSDEFPTNRGSDKETHSHLNYLLLLWRKSFRRQTSLKESMSMEKTLQTYGLPSMSLFSTKKTKQMEKHLNSLYSENLKVGLKIHKGKTKYTTKYADSEDILNDQDKIEKVTFQILRRGPE